jgi:uncharacterized protein affecting Mg2+/Co2+ transport
LLCDLGTSKRGQVVELDFANRTCVFLLGESWTDFLEQWASQLESGRHDVTERQEISLFDNALTKTATTRGIKVEATPLFAPEAAMTYGRGYIFTYRIRMSMVEQGEPCQLTTRHWEIRDERGFVNVVDGDGVIGFFPSFPGKPFQYLSCTPLDTPRGSMEGHFQFVV